MRDESPAGRWRQRVPQRVVLLELKGVAYLVRSPEPFVDIHCHLLPAIDDGAKSWDESLEMARMAVEDGTSAIIATPHQLGSFLHNGGQLVRDAVTEMNQRLQAEGIPLLVAPGADVRIEFDLVARLCRGEVLPLGLSGRYVLLELPHEMYMPLDRILSELTAAGYVGILSHPERNQGILAAPEVLPPLVSRGCLMQVTADSLTGGFGCRIQRFSEQLIERGLVHFVASDAHGTKLRRPVLSPAFARVAELTDLATAVQLFCRNPARVWAGKPIAIPRPVATQGGARGLLAWLTGKKAG